MSTQNAPLTEAATSHLVRLKVNELDVQVHYNDCGAGAETVVMLHGSGPGATGWANFHRNVDAFVGAGYRVVLMDCLGWGKSDPIVCTGSRSDLNAQTLKALLDVLKLDKVHIVGNSMGGMTVMSYAAHNPDMFGERVRGVALVATSSGGAGAVPPRTVATTWFWSTVARTEWVPRGTTGAQVTTSKPGAPCARAPSQAALRERYLL